MIAMTTTMKEENDQHLHSQRLQQLMAEVEGSHKVIGKSRSAQNKSDDLLAVFLRWSAFGIICLGAGFWTGSYNAVIRFSLQRPSETQLLNAQAWRNDGTGVFYRWCQGDCHSPKLYGGGVIQVFEVKCVNRPCGDIFMTFNVLNAKGEIIDMISLKEKGVQGETRRFFIESQNADAASLELNEFSARARV